MNKKQKKNLMRIIISAVILAFVIFADVEGPAQLFAYLVPYLIVGYDVLLKAVKGIQKRQPFDEYLLMAVASIGAFVIATFTGEGYTEATAVMWFYQVGELFESYAVGKSRENISNLMDIRPDYANIEDENGELEKVDPDEVEIGTIIVVKPGEKIPIDGVVVEGNSMLNTVALTGESLPREAKEGSEVLSGCITVNGLLKIRTTKEFDESTASKIIELVEDASSRKSRSEAFISKFARVYTPIVVYAAIALAVLPPLVRMLFLGSEPLWMEWIYRALTFLVISCPCALVISVPLSFFSGIGGASRQGVLIKGSNYMEALAQVDTVVFDKTGTLTKGVFELSSIQPVNVQPEELLHLLTHAEHFSTHPIAESIKRACKHEGDGCDVKLIEEVSGQGIKAMVNNHEVWAGNERLMKAAGVECSKEEQIGTVVHVAVDGKYMGFVVASDIVKENSKDAIAALGRNGIKNTVMLTGDKKAVAESVAKELGIKTVYSELLPQDKVAKVEELLEAEKSSNGKLAFVGDGINDAPVLSRADVGIAMGAMGSDAAIEAADIVLMDDDPLKISLAQRIARKTLGIVRQNIVFSIGIKVMVLVLGALGYANMWGAIFADVGVLILAVLNAGRALFTEEA